MLDVVGDAIPLEFCPPFQGAAPESLSPELALLSRQTQALAYIATQLDHLSSRVGQAIELPVELQPDYELATRRLLQEAV